MSVDISWLGHACFRIKSGQTTIITDPFPPELKYDLGKPSANIVTVSHAHASHAAADRIDGSPRVVHTPGEYEISGALITGLATFHDGQRGAERGKNTVYLIELDGITICHLGDIGHTLSSAHVEELEEVDVLLLPVGGVTTINAAQASEVIRQIEPKVVIPMHYGTPQVTGLEPVSVFLKEMGNEQIAPQPKLTLSKSMLPAGTQIYVLEYKAA